MKTCSRWRAKSRVGLPSVHKINHDPLYIIMPLLQNKYCVQVCCCWVVTYMYSRTPQQKELPNRSNCLVQSAKADIKLHIYIVIISLLHNLFVLNFSGEYIGKWQFFAHLGLVCSFGRQPRNYYFFAFHLFSTILTQTSGTQLVLHKFLAR